jgi:hypothetical protein
LASVEVNPPGLEVQLYVLPIFDGAPSTVAEFRQIALSDPAAAAGNGVTVTSTLFILEHPVAVIVSVTVYLVETSGVTDGLASVEINPAGADVQLYVFPETAAAPNWVVVFRHMALSFPAMAPGNGFTVTTTLWLLVHPVAEIVSVNV